MTAIEPYRGNRDRALAQVIAGGVAADVRAVGSNRYALALAGTTSDLRARLVGTFKDGSTIELGALEVAAGSKGAAHFSVVRPPWRRIDGVYLEIVGDDLHLRCAAPPLPPRGGLFLRAGKACVLCGVLLLGGSFLEMLATPLQIAGPARAIAGDTVRLGYATRPFGVTSYRASLDDGTLLAAGTLAPGSGELDVSLPASAARHRVRVDVAAELLPLAGEQRSTTTFDVTAPAANLPVPRIGSFSARYEHDGGTNAIVTSYLASADAGELTVADESGSVVARAPFSHLGTAYLPLPARAAGKPLIVRLEVRRGDERASTALRVAPPAPALAAVSMPVAAPALAPLPGGAAEGNAYLADDPFAVLGRPVAGHPFTIAIRRSFTSMHLRLEDDAGNPVDELDVPAGATSVELHAPGATTGDTYYVNCFYQAGGAQELVVRPVAIAAR